MRDHRLTAHSYDLLRQHDLLPARIQLADPSIGIGLDISYISGTFIRYLVVEFGEKLTKKLRQGDVLLIPVDKVPSTAKKSSDPVLVMGEVTGHAHRASSQVQVFRDPLGQTFIEGPGELTHEEHKTIQIPSGFFEVRRQREYNPIEENRQRRVMD